MVKLGIELEYVKEAFFRGAADIWTGNNRQVRTPGSVPGQEEVSVNLGHFRVVDSPLIMSRPNNKSRKLTVEYCNRALWVMQYGGWCDDEAALFLRSCLRQAYICRRRFYGGRGPCFVRDRATGLVYFNRIRRNSFGYCLGQEEIINMENKRTIERCWYRGKSLL